MEPGKPSVDVLLATYNGERFLAAQIESILGQDYRPIRLVVRDDGSSDASVAMVRAYAERYPGQVVLLNDAVGNLGAARNFLRLLEFSPAAYAMFSDQDDVWLPDKVSVTLAAMEEMEGRWGSAVPLLVHTDLTVVDEHLSPLARSFWAYQHLDPEQDGLNRLLVQNVVTGCTVLVNRSLMNLVRPVPAGMIEHDWWLALLAAAFGKIGHVARPTILYRQHEDNLVGAAQWDAWRMFRRFFQRGGKEDFIGNLAKTRVQALCFLQVYEPMLAQDVALMLTRYATLDRLGIFSRLREVFRRRFFKIGLKRNVGMVLTLVATPRSGRNVE